ncbi:MAG: aminopeptidase [Bacteroidales bacterium]|nr:aminopeptidase [Bacteroidales bacterium]
MKRFFKFCCVAVLAMACATPLMAQNSVPMMRMGGNMSAPQGGVLYGRLSKMPNISKIRKIETPRFAEKYEVFIEQELDQVNKNAGKFLQRVIVCHRGFDRPTVLVTEGYEANRNTSPGYTDELAELFNANIVVAEYRYFAKSMPEPCNWDYLTVENSLYDLHNIRQTFGELYKGKWISTGISKGGQTTMFYRAKFPNDVDISVPYVAPLNKGIEDGRHEKFLAKEVADEKSRQIVLDFQMEMMKRKAELLPMFKAHCDAKGYEFRLPIEEVYDYDVMEYSFAHWQWGLPIDKVPGADATNEEIFKYAIGILEPNYFAKQTPYTSFNVQAVRELGYYGYDMKPFKKYMDIKSPKDYMRRLMIIEELSGDEFDKTLYKDTKKFLKKNDPKMIYIYGEYDPWSASGVMDLKNKENIKIYVHPGGSHSTRINSFAEPKKSEIINTIKGWLEE